MMKTWQLFCSL